MMIRTVARGGLALALLTALAGCVPAYYPPYPGYYSRPAYAPPLRRAPSQGATGAQHVPEEKQSSSDWVNPEPAH